MVDSKKLYSLEFINPAKSRLAPVVGLELELPTAAHLDRGLKTAAMDVVAPPDELIQLVFEDAKEIGDAQHVIILEMDLAQARHGRGVGPGVQSSLVF